MTLATARNPRGTVTYNTNACTNPSLESNGTDWGVNWYGQGGAGSFERVTGASFSRYGTACARMTWSTKPTDTGTADAGIKYYSRDWVAGLTRSASGWMLYTFREQRGRVVILWYNSAGSLIGRSNGATTVLPADTWTRVSGTFTAPAGTATADVLFGLTGDIVNSVPAGKVNDQLLADGCLLAPFLSDYFDGSTAPYQDGSTFGWNGTAGASASTWFKPDPISLISPDMVLGTDYSGTTRSVAHQLYDGKVAAALMPGGLRKGVLRLWFLTRAQADQCEKQHRVPGVWTYVDDDNPETGMTYVPTGDLHVFNDANRQRWTVEIPFAEITP